MYLLRRSLDDRHMFIYRSEGTVIMRNRFMIMPHDGKDRGWLSRFYNDVQHYYRTSPNARLAISHCGHVELVDTLGKENTQSHCEACEQIENIRKEMDGNNDN